MKMRLNPGIIGFFASVLIRLLGVTWRIKYEGVENLLKAREISGNVIYSLWHGRLLTLCYTHRNKNIQVLTSQHYDGELIGRTIEWLKFGHLRGSSTRGGAKALRQLVGVLKRGLDAGLTIDGPKGPKGVVKQGVVEISRMTGCAILPISNTAEWRHLFHSWDIFQLPLPFSRVTLSYGTPIVVNAKADKIERERYRKQLRQSLDEITSELDRNIGHKESDVWPHEGL